MFFVDLVLTVLHKTSHGCDQLGIAEIAQIPSFLKKLVFTLQHVGGETYILEFFNFNHLFIVLKIKKFRPRCMFLKREP